jgi:hypothetical protein
MNLENRNILRLSGIVGIVASVLLCIGADLMFYSPNIEPGFSNLVNSLTSPFSVPHWRLVLGHYLVVLSFPIAIYSVLHIYLALKPSGQLGTLLLIAVEIATGTIGTVYNGTIPFFGTAVRVKNTLPESMQSYLIQMLSEFQDLQIGLQFVFLSGLALWSIIFVVLVLGGETLYPRWMALFNPILIGISLLLVLSLLPQTIAEYLAPVFFFGSNLIFYTISTVTVWNKEEKAIPNLAKTKRSFV